MMARILNWRRGIWGRLRRGYWGNVECFVLGCAVLCGVEENGNRMEFGRRCRRGIEHE